MYQRGTLKLKFDDPTMSGLEVRARRLSVDEMMAFVSLAEAGNPVQLLKREEDGSPPVLATTLAAPLLSWNLYDEEDPPQPVPCNVEGLLSQDFGLVISIVYALINATVPRVAPPLPQPSSNGAPSLAASMTMVPLSDPQMSTGTQDSS